MASVDEPVEKISAAREAVSEILSGLAESLQNADELHREFHGLGTTDKSTQLAVVTRCLEEQQAHIAATIATVETAQAQAQALHDGRSGTSSTSARPSPPPIVKDAPAYPHHKPHPLSHSDLDHVVNGDPNNDRKGGHAYGTGRPNKTAFPEGWEYDDIGTALKAVADRPEKIELRDNDRWYVTGTHRDIRVQAVVLPTGRIDSGWPLDGPGVKRNPPRRRR